MSRMLKALLALLVIILSTQGCKVRDEAETSVAKEETGGKQRFIVEVKDEKYKSIINADGTPFKLALTVVSLRDDQQLNIDLDDNHRSLGDGIAVTVELEGKNVPLKPIAVEPINNTSSPWLLLTSADPDMGLVVVAELEYTMQGMVDRFSYVQLGQPAAKNMLNAEKARYGKGTHPQSGCGSHALLATQCKKADQKSCNNPETPCLWDQVRKCCF